MQARLLSNNSLFSPVKLIPSFADKLVALDHELDQKLIELYKELDLDKSLDKDSNPLPDDEIEHYYLQTNHGKGKMLIRNFLLLSRLFIRHAKLMNLPQCFSEKSEIKILDLGCGNAPDLLGILALFGMDRIEYFGVDNYKTCFNECAGVYAKLMKKSDITFVYQDAREFLMQNEYRNYFDLVLIQHPNLQLDHFRPVFTEIFQKTSHVIAPGGFLYSTFYMQKEADYFIKEVLPKMQGMEGYDLVKSESYKEEAKINVENEKAGSENYIFMSPPLNLSYVNKHRL